MNTNAGKAGSCIQYMSPKMLPNFLVVGAPKSGTTSMYEYLKQHPQIYLNENIKESNFFIEPKSVLGNGPRFFGERSYGSSIEKYMCLFKNVKQSHRSIGEVCPTYLPYHKYAIPNIKKYLGENVKIIIILRNPVERAFSHYMNNVRDTDETEDFETALELEKDRITNNYWHSFYLTTLGMYYEQVKSYIEAFHSVRIFLFEDLKRGKILEPLFSFLDLDPISVDIRKTFNVSGRPRSKKLQKILNNDYAGIKSIRNRLGLMLGKNRRKKLKSIFQELNLKKEKMKHGTRSNLIKMFRSDIANLENLIDRDLSHWIE